MARVHHRKAAKDYPDHGIAKGDMYYYTKIKTGPYTSRELRSKVPFKRSQLTQSDYLGQLYDWQDEQSALVEMDSAEALADTIESLGEEQREKLDNMPEGLQQGSTGEMLEERASACETAAEEIREVISEWEDARNAWETEIETYKTDLAAHKASEEEPDLPDHTRDNGDDAYEFDEDEWLDRVKEVSVD